LPSDERVRLAFLDLLNGCAKQLMDQPKTAHDKAATAHGEAKQRLPRAYVKDVKAYEQNRGAHSAISMPMPSSTSGRPRSMFARSRCSKLGAAHRARVAEHQAAAAARPGDKAAQGREGRCTAKDAPHQCEHQRLNKRCPYCAAHDSRGHTS
jgi:hypothetical protein